MALDAYKIVSSDINPVAVSTAVSGDKLTGTVLQNKQVFDAFPNMIVTKFNNLCEYVGTQSPSGDAGLNYSASEISTITSTLGCTEASITL